MAHSQLTDHSLTRLTEALVPPGTDVYARLVSQEEIEEKGPQNWLQRLLRRPAFVAYRKVRVPVGPRKRLSLTKRQPGLLKFANVDWNDIDYSAAIVGAQFETKDGTVLWYHPWPLYDSPKLVYPGATFHLVDVKVSIA